MVCHLLPDCRAFTYIICLIVLMDCHKFGEGEVLLLNKPLYWTSFDLVNKVKAALRHHCGLKKIKVGHAGTLDPLATGLMIVCTGRATKRIEEFRDLTKEYTAIIKFGQTTPSFDLESQVDMEYPADHITAGSISEKLTHLLGEQLQEPPLFSAKFVDGQRAYELARKKVVIPGYVAVISGELEEELGAIVHAPDYRCYEVRKGGSLGRSRFVGFDMEGAGCLIELRNVERDHWTITVKTEGEA